LYQKLTKCQGEGWGTEEKKASQLRDALNLINEADLLGYKVGKCGLGKR